MGQKWKQGNKSKTIPIIQVVMEGRSGLILESSTLYFIITFSTPALKDPWFFFFNGEGYLEIKISKNSLQTKVRDEMASQLNATKHTKKNFINPSQTSPKD